MIVVVFSSPLALRPVARSAFASLRWSGVISLSGRPLRSRGMKCQFSRSSFLKSNLALACCSGERDFRKPCAAAAMSSETLPKSASTRTGGSTVIAATATIESPATAPSVIPKRRMFMSPPVSLKREYSSNYAEGLPLFRSRVDNRPRMSPVSFVLALIPVVSQQMGVDWRKDYDSARAEAREKGRLLLLHFYMEGRPVCKTMDEETFAQADVARVAHEKFVSVRVE